MGRRRPELVLTSDLNIPEGFGLFKSDTVPRTERKKLKEKGGRGALSGLLKKKNERCDHNKSAPIVIYNPTYLLSEFLE